MACEWQRKRNTQRISICIISSFPKCKRCAQLYQLISKLKKKTNKNFDIFMQTHEIDPIEIRLSRMCAYGTMDGLSLTPALPLQPYSQQEMIR